MYVLKIAQHIAGSHMAANGEKMMQKTFFGLNLIFFILERKICYQHKRKKISLWLLSLSRKGWRWLGWTLHPFQIFSCGNVGERRLSESSVQQSWKLRGNLSFSYLHRSRRHCKWKANSQKWAHRWITGESLRVLQSVCSLFAGASSDCNAKCSGVNGFVADATEGSNCIVYRFAASFVLSWLANDSTSLTQKRKLSTTSNFADLTGA